MKALTDIERSGTTIGFRILACAAATALLTVIPLRAFGDCIIDADQPEGVELDTFCDPKDTSATVNAGVTVTAGMADSAIFSDTRAWDLINNGTLDGSGSDFGVRFSRGGTVDNRAGGVIRGGVDGVQTHNEAGLVLNAGTITGGDYGVLLLAGGTVRNEAGGFIDGSTAGVAITGAAGMVVNAGRIGGDDFGIRLQGGGTVTNLVGGLVIADDSAAIEIDAGAGTVVNAGSIVSEVDGVRMTAGGMVDNQAGGLILGGDSGRGVRIFGGVGTVINAGTITSPEFSGVLLGGGGSVVNQAGGGIFGADSGVQISGGSGSVLNAGFIDGIPHGVSLLQGGSVSNQATGTIRGDDTGVSISGGSGNVFNAGTITAFEFGVRIAGGAGSVINAGTITGNEFGIFLAAGGSVTNLMGGFINGNDAPGVLITGGAGTVFNAGTITSDEGDAVRLFAGGTVVNQAGGVIHVRDVGNAVGVSTGLGSLINAGTITSPDGTGVAFSQGGSVENLAGGTIRGEVGVRISNDTATVRNAGTIEGTGGLAILLSDVDDTLTLQTGSDIVGDSNGGDGTDDLFLQGTGTENDTFVDFERLTMQGVDWELSGDSTFSESATVEAGLLRITGVLTSPMVLVQPNAALGGNGTVSGDVTVLGAVQPGNSIDTLFIDGSLTFEPGSIYDVDADSLGNSDLIEVSGAPGTATLNGGVVRLALAPAIYDASTTYEILSTTDGVAGEFDAVISPSIFLAASLETDPNTVFVVLDRLSFGSVARTANQRAVGRGLDEAADDPGDLTDLLLEFFQFSDAAEARAALDSLSGEAHATVASVSLLQHQFFTDTLRLRMERVRAGKEGALFTSRPILLASASPFIPATGHEPTRPWGVWLRGHGLFGELDADGNAAEADFTLYGGSGGIEYRISREFLAGAALGYSRNDVDIDDRQSDADVDAIQLAAYGTYSSDPWHVDGAFSFGFLQTDVRRQIVVGEMQQTADADYDGYELSAYAEAGYRLQLGEADVRPVVGVQYSRLSQDSFRESGAGANGLSVDRLELDSLRTRLGFWAVMLLDDVYTGGIVMEVRARWEHEFLDDDASLDAQFIGGGGKFVVRGVKQSRDSVVVGTGLTVLIDEAIHAFVDYDARLNDQLTAHAFSAGVGIRW